MIWGLVFCSKIEHNMNLWMTVIGVMQHGAVEPMNGGTVQRETRYGWIGEQGNFGGQFGQRS